MSCDEQLREAGGVMAHKRRIGWRASQAVAHVEQRRNLQIK